MLNIGIVEDIHDPQKMGRVRVRIFGMHSSDKLNNIKTEDLPWALVMTPTTSPSTSGVGQNPFLVEGGWVVCQFFDEAGQQPIVIGTLAGNPTEKRDPETGFADPLSIYPRRINENDLAKRARGEENPIPKAQVGSEPADPYAAEYPFNKVIHTESGHYIELDDTPEYERVHIYHRMGSSIEIHPNGDMVVHSGGHWNSSKTLEINVNDDATINVGGSLSAYVDGTTNVVSKSDVNVNTDGNLNATVKGSASAWITGATSIFTQSNVDIAANGTLNLQSAGNMAISSGGTLTLNSVGKFVMNTAADCEIASGTNMTVSSKGTGTIVSEGIMAISAAANVTIDGTNVRLNDDGGADTRLTPIVTAFPAAPSGITRITEDPRDSALIVPTGTAEEVVDYTDDEKEAFLNDIAEVEPEMVLNVPLWAAVKSDGSTSYATETAAGVTVPREDQSSDPTVITPEDNPNINRETDRTTITTAPAPDHISGVTSGDALDPKIQERADAAVGGSVTYRCFGTRRLKAVSALENIIKSAAASTGYDAVIFSAGQDSTTGRVGSARHNNGFGVDVWIYNPGTTLKLSSTGTEAQAFANAAKSAGATSIGVGTRYMGGVGIHIDIAQGNSVAAEAAKHWGNNGRSKNSPSWLSGLMSA